MKAGLDLRFAEQAHDGIPVKKTDGIDASPAVLAEPSQEQDGTAGSDSHGGLEMRVVRGEFSREDRWRCWRARDLGRELPWSRRTQVPVEGHR